MTCSQECSQRNDLPALHPDSEMKYLQGLSAVGLVLSLVSLVVGLEGVLGSVRICFNFKGIVPEVDGGAV